MPCDLRKVLYFLQCYNAHHYAMVVEHTADGSDSRTTKRFFLRESRSCYLMITILTIFSKKVCHLLAKIFDNNFAFRFHCQCTTNNTQKYNGLQKTLLCKLPPRSVAHSITSEHYHLRLGLSGQFTLFLRFVHRLHFLLNCFSKMAISV